MARIDLNGNTVDTPDPQIQQPTPQAAQPAGYGDVQGYYQKYLGRAANADDPNKWLSGAYGYGTDLGSIENAIKSSDEAQAYAKAQGGGAAGGGGQPSGGGDLMSRIQQQLAYAKSSDDPNYWYQKISGDPNGGGSAWQYWQDRINRGNGAQLGLPLYNDTPAGGGAGGGAYAGTNVFSDPATANFEQLLNSMISRFNTPQTPPGYQQAIDQMNTYLTQLNGPVYTPQQMDLMQTQAWDPMQQQHDAAKQQLMQRLGARGIAPTSGVFQSAMEDLDRQFQQAHTQTQANFSNQAIGLQRQNQAQAAQLAPAISNFQQAQTGWQDQRALQAESLAALIPAMAQQRLQTASGAVQPMSPTAIMTLINSMQNQGYNQGAGYGSGIAQLLASLFGLS